MTFSRSLSLKFSCHIFKSHTIIMSLYPLNSNSAYIDKTSNQGEIVEAILNTRGLSCCSMIICASDNTSLSEVYYNIYVSHICKNWMFLREHESCGIFSSYDIRWTPRNQSVFSNIMRWRFVKFWILNKPNRLVLSAR